jgi:hypothetical protein
MGHPGLENVQIVQVDVGKPHSAPRDLDLEAEEPDAGAVTSNTIDGGIKSPKNRCLLRELPESRAPEYSTHDMIGQIDNSYSPIDMLDEKPSAADERLETVRVVYAVP